MADRHPVLKYLDDAESQARCHYEAAIAMRQPANVIDGLKKHASRVRVIRDEAQRVFDERDALLLEKAMPDPSTPAKEPSVTHKQLHILRHALGLTNGGREYRNHFVTGAGSKDYASCSALVDMGLMTKHRGGQLTGGDDLFIVTKAGMALARGGES